jgi:hypothetical protein
VKEALTLREFVEHPRFRGLVENPQTRLLGIQADFPALLRSARDPALADDDRETILSAALHQPVTEEVFSAACACVEDMSFVGISERFRDSCRILLERLGLPDRAGLLESVPAGPAEVAVEDTVREMIEQKAAFDCRLYQLALRNLEKRAQAMSRGAAATIA